MRSQKMLIAIATCLCLSVIVSAHPGRTDSNGGHFDHGSGGYHYHHGYSAHQHSDMDGDGNLDCPYSFDDKTNSSGNHSNSYTFNKSPSDKTESSSNDTEPIKNESSKKSKDYTFLLAVISCIAIYGLPILVSVIRDRRRK